MAKSKKLPEVLTEDEIAALLDQFNPRYAGPRRNRLMIKLALETGLWIAELTSLRFEDCRLNGGVYRIHVKDGKGGKDRVVWMTADLGAAIGEMATREGREHVGLMFTTREGGEIDHGYLRRMIKQRGTTAGIPRLHFLLLRHTSLTRLYSRTKDLRLVQTAAGHASPTTTAIYAHVSEEDLRDAMIETAEALPGK